MFYYTASSRNETTGWHYFTGQDKAILNASTEWDRSLGKWNSHCIFQLPWLVQALESTEHRCVQKCGSHRQQEVSMLMLEPAVSMYKIVLKLKEVKALQSQIWIGNIIITEGVLRRWVGRESRRAMNDRRKDLWDRSTQQQHDKSSEASLRGEALKMPNPQSQPRLSQFSGPTSERQLQNSEFK